MVFEIKIEERKRFGLVSVNNAFERLKQQAYAASVQELVRVYGEEAMSANFAN